MNNKKNVTWQELNVALTNEMEKQREILSE